MPTQVSGLHHITAIASDPRQNLGSYTRVLGLRFVKKAVNQDDPGTYHLYYGDHAASPGTILTFFPWMGLRRGHPSGRIASAQRFSRWQTTNISARLCRRRFEPGSGFPANRKFLSLR